MEIDVTLLYYFHFIKTTKVHSYNRYTSTGIEILILSNINSLQKSNDVV